MTSGVSKNIPTAAGLYIVATPIGNMADITFRAVEILAAADLIACEDTRVSRALLAKYGARARTISLNDHNESAKIALIRDEIKAGRRVALVSDAGTPLISDPGYKLAAALRREGLPVHIIPGPSAPIAALALSGLPSDRFMFAGFAPAKTGARAKFLNELKGARATLIFFETANRLVSTLSAMAEIFGDRRASVARELTKIHEEVRNGTCAELLSHYTANPPKGEIVVLVEAAEADAADMEKARRAMALLTARMGVKDAAEVAAPIFGISKNEAYKIGLEAKK